jgi:hypothetical protein
VLTDDQPRGEIYDEQIRFDCTTLATFVSRIEVQRNQLFISMKSTNGSSESEALSISWHKPLSKRPRKILLPTALSERTSGPSASNDALGSSAPLREAADGSMKS